MPYPEVVAFAHTAVGVEGVAGEVADGFDGESLGFVVVFGEDDGLWHEACDVDVSATAFEQLVEHFLVFACDVVEGEGLQACVCFHAVGVEVVHSGCPKESVLAIAQEAESSPMCSVTEGGGLEGDLA